MPFRPVLRAAVAAAALLPALPAAAQMSAAAAAHAGAPDRVLDFQVDWGPLKLAEVTFRLEGGEDGLRLDLSGESTGLAALIADFKVEHRILYAPDGARRFAALGSFGDETSRREVLWSDAAAEPQVRIDASAEEGPRTPIPPGELVDTVDPAFPMLDALKRVEAGGECTAVYRVFDGERRMNVILEDEGDEVLEADRRWTYSGPARRCRLRFERVGGFSVDRASSSDRVREQDYERTLWVARLEDGMAPVRLRVAWPLGYATGRIDLR